MSDELIDVCPKCDSANLESTSASTMFDAQESENDYRCNDCLRTFDTLKQREPINDAGDGAGGELTAALADASPDEWP